MVVVAGMSPNLADVRIRSLWDQGLKIRATGLHVPDEGGLAAVTSSHIKNAGVDNENIYGSFFRIVFWTRCPCAKFESAGEYRSVHGGRQNSRYVLHSRIERIVILVPST
jgi:hypothetical protein